MRLVLLAAAADGTPVAGLLRAAAEGAVATLDAAAPAAAAPLPDPDEAPPTRFAVAVPVRRRPVATLAGAAAIALGGVAAVLAVQVGVGPLGGVLPFLAPDEPVATSGTDPGPGDPGDPTAPVPVQPVTDAGAPIAPLPAPAPVGGPGADANDPDGPGGPGTTPPTQPPPPPVDQPGPTSSLLDPVVSTVVSAVDGATGGALGPVTSLVEGTADEATDVLDDTVGGVLGLLQQPTR